MTRTFSQTNGGKTFYFDTSRLFYGTMQSVKTNSAAQVFPFLCLGDHFLEEEPINRVSEEEHVLRATSQHFHDLAPALIAAAPFANACRSADVCSGPEDICSKRISISVFFPTRFLLRSHGRQALFSDTGRRLVS